MIIPDLRLTRVEYAIPLKKTLNSERLISPPDRPALTYDPEASSILEIFHQ
jgi:hypothetical protein